MVRNVLCSKYDNKLRKEYSFEFIEKLLFPDMISFSPYSRREKSRKVTKMTQNNIEEESIDEAMM